MEQAEESPMHYIRKGKGKQLLLIHGLGGSWRSWNTILEELAKEREVIAIDLPGFGQTPPLQGEVTLTALTDAVIGFLREKNWVGIDVVGSSMGAMVVLELVKRGGIVGVAVALDPGGFWRGWQRSFFSYSIAISIRLVRVLLPVMPMLVKSNVARTLLFFQLSARPWKLPPQVLLDEMKSYATSPSFDEALRQVGNLEVQKGAPANSVARPLYIGWGRKDRICFPSQAMLARSLFPDALWHWFEKSGHFPHWDEPKETIALILHATQ